MTLPLRLLTGIPLAVMAIVLLFVGIQRLSPPAGAQDMSLGDLLAKDGRLDDAMAWHSAMSADGQARSLRRLAEIADLAGEPGIRANALQRLVRAGHGGLDDHIAAARALAAAGAQNDALTILYNAEQRFPDALDEAFLSFYARLAQDAGRPDIALPLAQRLWARTKSDRSLRVLMTLSPPD
jgi:hypothetical protein